MMKVVLLCFGALSFSILFWEENLGMNLLIYSLILIVLGYFASDKGKVSKPAIISAIGVVATALFVVYHNSTMAKFMNITSVIMYVGFINQHGLKQVFHAIPTSIANLCLAPSRVYDTLTSSSQEGKSTSRFGRTFKLMLIPALFFTTFYIIFYFSNAIFADMTDRFWNVIAEFFNSIFKHFSIGWILTFFLG